MATVEKIRRDIEKTKEKISEQQKRLRTLEAQLTEEENLEIVRMVKAVKMDNRELTAFLKVRRCWRWCSVPRLLRCRPPPAAGMENPTTLKRPGQRPLTRRMPRPRRSL